MSNRQLEQIVEGIAAAFTVEKAKLWLELEQMKNELRDRLAAVRDGEPGPAGRDGNDGAKGDNGDRGEPGEVGPPGESVRGEKGEPGADGSNGRDGVTGEARGKYDAAETYGKLDRVSFNGSEWIARRDDPGPLPGDGWMLGAQAKRGRPGIDGKDGKDGTGIRGVTVEDYSLTVQLTDGKTVAVDLRPMFERYHEERGG